MTLQQLTYLTKVAECGNITEAAEKYAAKQVCSILYGIVKNGAKYIV